MRLTALLVIRPSDLLNEAAAQRRKVLLENMKTATPLLIWICPNFSMNSGG